jgi:ubiquinone/menaquinone biosynthesis C-methylase UbiE
VTAKPASVRRETVPAALDAGAFAYDRLVGASPGHHAQLRQSASRMRLPDEGGGLRLLDAGCGTGASTAALLAVAPRAEITAIDPSGEMLARARAKQWPASVTFVHAPVEELAAAGFTAVHSETVPGWQRGIVHTFLASRSPLEPG